MPALRLHVRIRFPDVPQGYFGLCDEALFPDLGCAQASGRRRRRGLAERMAQHLRHGGSDGLIQEGRSVEISQTRIAR